jgi:glycosidase
MSKKHLVFTVIVFTFMLLLSGCSNESAFSGSMEDDSSIESFQAGATSNDFREESIYFVMTTRFMDGDPSNNVHCWADGQAGNPDSDPAWRGDFKGLVDKLDYIKALGFSAIWITPPVKNSSGYDYHGYHAINFKEIDPRYKTAYDSSAEEAYQKFIDACHAKGLKVVQDVVYNHSGNFGEENLYPLFRRNAPTGLNEDIDDALTKIAPVGKLPADYDTMLPNEQYGARIAAMKEDSIDTGHIYHHEKSMSWESYSVQTGQIAGDCVDLNTENPVVAQYLREFSNKYIDMGVDAFRVDTVKHISRLTFNKELVPQIKAYAGDNFYIFGEVCTRYRQIWNNGIPAISSPFYTWKEDKNYAWGTRTTNEASVFQNWEDNDTVSNEPTTNNHYLNGNSYHTPDWSQRSGLDVIDFPMHWNFANAYDAFNVALGGDSNYSDATWSVTYIDSHDYAPDTAPENQRFALPQDVWAENLSLIFSFRGIPTIYYGSEIEFKKGAPIDVGPNAKLEDTGRAYFGDHLAGSVSASDFGVYNASGTVANTLAHPLAQHIRRLNMIRHAVPALQKGQYSRDGVSGGMAFKRRYTGGGVDSMALVTISGDSNFAGIPNGTYRDAITGHVVSVTNGSLYASCSGKGNMRVYVLNGPGKIGTDGAYLYGSGSPVTTTTIGGGEWTEAYFRGTPNNWTATAMTKVATSTWETTQTFGDADPRFKIDHYGDWNEAYPSGADYSVTGNKTYKITFRDDTKDISVTEVVSTTTTTTTLSGGSVRTVIFMLKPTTSGQDIFVKGGHDGGLVPSPYPSMSEPISYNNTLNATTAAIKAADASLDWGSESALDWTTNSWPASWGTKKTYAVDGYGEDPENTWGAHYWKFDVQMSGNTGDWYEFKAFMREGSTEWWESDRAQSGTPYNSINHWGKKGFITRCEYNQNWVEFTQL